MTNRIDARRSLVLPIILAAAVGGCGGQAVSPAAREGRSAFSYDDDEVDPKSLKPRKGQPRAGGRR